MQADIILENYKVGTLSKFGLDEVSLRKINPRLIYCSVTGFGQTGPRREQPAYDFLIQAMGGLMSVTGERDGKPGAGPQKVGVPIVDLMTGMYTAV
jgi:crotonobetainyl-CoA:carnitine CoA-transferase CaiB-like acyl-CoA transferase